MMRREVLMVLALGLAGCGGKATEPADAGNARPTGAARGKDAVPGLPASSGETEIDLKGRFRCWGGNQPNVNFQFAMKRGVKPREGGAYWFVFEHHGARKEHKIEAVKPGVEVTGGYAYEDWIETNSDPNPARFWIEFRPSRGDPVRVSPVVTTRDENRPPGK